MRTPSRTRAPRWIAAACALALAGIPSAALADAPCDEIGTLSRALAGEQERDIPPPAFACQIAEGRGEIRVAHIVCNSTRRKV